MSRAPTGGARAPLPHTGEPRTKPQIRGRGQIVPTRWSASPPGTRGAQELALSNQRRPQRRRSLLAFCKLRVAGTETRRLPPGASYASGASSEAPLRRRLAGLAVSVGADRDRRLGRSVALPGWMTHMGNLSLAVSAATRLMWTRSTNNWSSSVVDVTLRRTRARHLPKANSLPGGRSGSRRSSRSRWSMTSPRLCNHSSRPSAPGSRHKTSDVRSRPSEGPVDQGRWALVDPTRQHRPISDTTPRRSACRRQRGDP